MNAEVRPEFIRLPLAPARCPYTGLSRATLCELTIPSEKNDYRAPVRSVLIKKRGALRGIRLVDFDSLMKYLNSLAETSEQPHARAS